MLDLDGRTFLARAVDTLVAGGCTDVVVVVADAAVADAAAAVDTAAAGAAAAGAAAPTAAAERAVVRVVWNAAPGSEQLDSLVTGLNAMPEEVAGAVVLPVDHPLVEPDTVRALLGAGLADPDAVVRPTLDGVPGHPTLFPRVLWPQLHDPSLPEGARSVVESPGTRTVDVAVQDRGVLADIDTPAAYRRYVVEGRGRARGGVNGGGR